MSEHATDMSETNDAEELRSSPGLPRAIETTEVYEVDDATVFYDAENPLAWLQTDEPVTLQDVA